MNDLDDIFPAPAEQSTPPSPSPQKQVRAWWQLREEKQRKTAYATLDGIFRAFSEGTGNIQTYLDTHSRFDRYSARNALLIAAQAPQARRIGDYKYWAAQGAEILKTEKRSPIVVLEPGKPYKRQDGSVGQGYYAKELFDISQTTARGQPLPDVTYDRRLLLRALIHNPPVPIQAVDELPQAGHGALFLPRQNTILVQKGLDAAELFRCVSLELAHAQLCLSGQEYSRDANSCKARCVSYMLCRKYDIETAGLTLSGLNDMFKGMDPTQIPSVFSEMENAMGAINSRMARVLSAHRNPRQNDKQR